MHSLEEARRLLRATLDKNVKLKLQNVDHIHVSLTRVVTLKHHWMDDFVSSLAKVSNSIKDTHLGRTATLCSSGHRVLANEEGTRTFIGVEVEDKGGLMLALTAALDEQLADFGLPAFYQPPVYHASLLWTLGDQNKELSAVLDRERPLDHWKLGDGSIESLECKIGHKVYSFPLKD